MYKELTTASACLASGWYCDRKRNVCGWSWYRTQDPLVFHSGVSTLSYIDLHLKVLQYTSMTLDVTDQSH